MGDRRQRSDDDDEFETRRSSRRHDRERTKGSKRRDRSSRRSDESEYSDSEEDRRKGKRAKRDIKEEEIMDYMVKKAQKKALKVAKKLKANEAGYSNDSNPFGDSNLAEKFVWRKKIERDIMQGVPLDISVKAEKKRQREKMAEIEKVKKRREERAIEKAQREEEMAMLARERARAEFLDWEKKEEEFHFDQSKVRSEIRLREGRARPIDMLTKTLNSSEEFDFDLNEPYIVFKGLTVKDLEELRDDIKMHLDLDTTTPIHIRYWEALMVVCNWELAGAQKKDAIDRARVRGEQPPPEVLAEERGLHSSIEADVKNLLEGENSKELELMQQKIESQMRSGTAKVVEYWEAILKHLQIYKAKATLREIHASLLRKHLQHSEYPAEVENQLEEHEDAKTEEDELQDLEDSKHYSPEHVIEDADEPEEAGSFSPQLLQGDEDDEAIDPEEDWAELERKRKAIEMEQQMRTREAMTAKKVSQPEDNMELKAMKAMGAMDEGDAVFGAGSEVTLDSQVYWWHDKYRPRKPKYFNRVHTGYEWNKYNQTHYDHDNPPPKIVQGYKFNIFYPDLVDKSRAPVYTIEKDGNSDETCIIRFHAGPPYEDIAFRIVNKEWEYSHKKGFKSTFERGILHLYFNFKRYRYRR
ncbi:splicing factor Cactin-like [Curcuma longa]|uniref:splicing factor Cactin-like n=1 Tax=Curcuma longa TaxID=136217 RepID=UPI003D9E713D